MVRSRNWLLVHNIGVLYGLQAVRYVVPLILVPYLAQTLGLAMWGLLSFAQGVALYLGSVVEYSFPAVGTRAVAAHREDHAIVQRLLEDVTTAKLILAAGSLSLAVGIGVLQPELRAAPRLFGLCAAAAVLQAAHPYWFLNGQERMRAVAAITSVERILGLVLIVWLVRQPGDAWKVPAVQIGMTAGALSVAYGLVGRTYTIRRFRWRGAWRVMRVGRSLFGAALAVKGYAASGVVLLGALASPEAAGLYAAAEKIVRACTGLLQPITQAVYPRLAYLVRQAQALGHRTMRTWLGRTTVVGFLLGGSLFLTAPWIVDLALGEGYEGAAALLRILAVLPLLIAMSSALGLYWMLQLHMDRPFAFITVTAALGAVGLALGLVPVYGARGMAWIVVGTEAFVGLAMYAWLRTQGVQPLASSDPESAS